MEDKKASEVKNGPSEVKKDASETVSDLSKEWGDDEEANDTTKDDTASQDKEAARDTEESIESIVSFIQARRIVFELGALF